MVVRPSGTEPKLKCYLEAVVPVAPSADPGTRSGATSALAAARTQAARTLTAVRTQLEAALGL